MGRVSSNGTQEKMLAVIARFSVDNHVTINFQDDESLILENYLSL
jgi:hypothetical protein